MHAGNGCRRLYAPEPDHGCSFSLSALSESFVPTHRRIRVGVIKRDGRPVKSTVKIALSRGRHAAPEIRRRRSTSVQFTTEGAEDHSVGCARNRTRARTYTFRVRVRVGVRRKEIVAT